MNESIGDRAERAARARIAPKGSVLLRVDGQERRGRIGNIGEGGMFVFIDVAALGSWSGCSVDFEIRFDGARAEWLRGTGRVVRLQARGLALAFDVPTPAELLHKIAEMTAASHAHARVMSVVLIDADLKRRSAIAAGFRATGCVVEEAASPLEAIVRLGQTNFEPDVIAVADSHPSAAADEMRVFVERDHSDALLITVGDEILAPHEMAPWLSSADPKADLAARVREILVHQVRRTAE